MFSKKGLQSTLALISITTSVASLGAQLAPPPYEVKNRHQVDMTSGQVSPSMTDVKIGGQLGLEHSIGTYTSNFVNLKEDSAPVPLMHAFREKYKGGIYRAPYSQKYVQSLRVFGDDASVDFDISADGKTFTARNDASYTLTYVNSTTDRSSFHASVDANFIGFILNKPDGTLLYFPSATLPDYKLSTSDATLYSTPGNSPILTKIQRPNGLIININTVANSGTRAISSVTTNTGFQLKFIYQQNTAPYAGDNINPNYPSVDSWYKDAPRYVVGINNGVEFCSTDVNQTDATESLSADALIKQACPDIAIPGKWPKVGYEWPNGMPRAMYMEQGTFKVTDPAGNITEYVHSPQGMRTNTPVQPLWYTSPRLTQIKVNGKVMMNYEYLTDPMFADAFTGGAYSAFYWPQPQGRISSSWIKSDKITYNVSHPLGQHEEDGRGSDSTGYKTISTQSQTQTGVFLISAWDKSVELEGRVLSDFTNRVKSISNTLGGTNVSFDYYGLTHNVTMKRENGTYDSYTTLTGTVYKDGNISYAGGYAPCSLSNFKICNQATWIKDANGNTTNYVYDPVSGQPSKVTLPADKNGVNPETRYTYTAMYAYYKQLVSEPAGSPSSIKIRASSTPIYLLTHESKCQKSAATANGCSGDDEIKTDYYYGPQQNDIPNNLFLRGVAVTAKNSSGTQETRLTCYTYDDYGNRISETKPKGNTNLTVCN